MQTMNNYKQLCIIFLMFNLYSSCEFQQKTNSTGRSLEIIVVQTEKCSDTNFELFKEHCFLEQRPLVETELYGERKNLFYLIPIAEQDFSKIFSTHKNIVFVNGGKKFLLEDKKEVWAKNQNAIFFTIDNDAPMYLKKEEIKKVALKIKENEIQRRINIYKKETPEQIKKYINNRLGASISMPSGFFIIDSLNSILSLRRDTKKSTQRILISLFDHESTIDNILAEQNRISKNYISSTLEKSFLCVEERASLYLDTIIGKNQKTINIKGLWTMKGDFMGGGFSTNLISSTISNKKILISFYLYAPNENKAQHLINAESILTSMRLINN